jgi:hypothetical protein
MMSDSFLSDAGWLFFAGWSLVIAALGIAAFGRDLLPTRADSESTQKLHAEHTVSPQHAVPQAPMSQIVERRCQIQDAFPVPPVST